MLGWDGWALADEVNNAIKSTKNTYSPPNKDAL